MNDDRLPWERLLVAMGLAFLAGVILASCGKIVEPRPCPTLVTDSAFATGPAGDTGAVILAPRCAEAR